MLGWDLLRSDCSTATELWKTPTKFLVCRKYFGQFRFEESFKEAMDFYLDITINKQEFK